MYISMHMTCQHNVLIIHRDNFGEEVVDTEKFKKEVRTGPHEEMTLAEYIDVSTYTFVAWAA